MVTSTSPALYVSQDDYRFLLEWDVKDVFQVSGRGSSLPCVSLSGGFVGQSVHFIRDGGAGKSVVSLTVPGLFFGVSFDKDQS